ncbi:MAG: FimB/Mfa2 family fimbrial subunit [Alistipes sp.]|nr:FimB/Mfa2 family fimbrial subunit [Alistipes sp.]
MKAKFLALAALVLGLASCQSDFDGGTANVGGEVDFQLSVGAEELATRASEDKVDDGVSGLNSVHGAIDYLQATDWTAADLRYTLEVYDVASDYSSATPVKDRMVKIVDKYAPVVFDLRLVPGRDYYFVVFADFVAEGEAAKDVNPAISAQADLGLHHSIGQTLADITIKEPKNTDLKNNERGGLNNELTDAYFATKEVRVDNSAVKDILLKRPYGKLRVIATDLAELNINVEPKSMKVAYTATHPQKLNALTGEVEGYDENVEYTLTSTYNEGVSKESLANHFYTTDFDAKKDTYINNATRHTHMTLFTDYILAEKDGQTAYHFTMDVLDGNGERIKRTAFSTDIPVERNKLTTVIGNVLTTATEIEVRIDDNFAGYLEEVVEEPYANITNSAGEIIGTEVYNEEGIAVALTRAAKDTDHQIVINNDITMPQCELVWDDTTKEYKYTNTPITITDGVPSGSNWAIICPYHLTFDDAFTGSIDGNGKTIEGICIANQGSFTGLIGCMWDGASVKNLVIENAAIVGGEYVGAVAGRSQNGTLVENVQIVNSTISGTDNVGGILGINYRRKGGASGQGYDEGWAIIRNSSTDTETKVIGSGEQIGGIVGYNYGAIIINCENNADITGKSKVAGICGSARDYHHDADSYIVACTSTAEATITANSGSASGIVGHTMTDVNHRNTYAPVVACESYSKLVGNQRYALGRSQNNKYIACVAVKNGAQTFSDYNSNVISSYLYEATDVATDSEVADMNAAIATFNATAPAEAQCSYVWSANGGLPSLN